METMEHFLETADGGCRRVESTGYRLREFPFTTNLTINCKRPGEHPHEGTRGEQLLKIKRDMSDPSELEADSGRTETRGHHRSAGHGLAA